MWSIVPKPTYINTICNWWKHKIKHKFDGFTEKSKTRLVVKGDL